MKMNLGDVIGESVSTTAILAHEYYTHPESNKNIPSPQFLFTCFNLFNSYLKKQIMLVKTVDDVKEQAKKFVQLVVEESKKADDEARKLEESKKQEEENKSVTND